MNFLKIIMIILSIGFTSSSYAQQQIVQEDNIVFLLRQPEHFAQAVKTVASLKQKDVSRINPSKVVIIVCGEMVKQLSSGEMSRQTGNRLHTRHCGVCMWPVPQKIWFRQS